MDRRHPVSGDRALEIAAHSRGMHDLADRLTRSGGGIGAKFQPLLNVDQHEPMVPPHKQYLIHEASGGLPAHNLHYHDAHERAVRGTPFHKKPAFFQIRDSAVHPG